MRGAALVRVVLTLIAVISASIVAPRALCGRRADAAFDGLPDEVLPLSRTVTEYVDAGVMPDAFHTGSARFDGEWAYGTLVMSVLGLSQVALARPPEERGAFVVTLRRATTQLLDPRVRAFGTVAWGNDAMAELPGGRGHAYLGYAALAVSLARLVDPELPVRAQHDALIAALARRLDEAPHGVFETYPGESYPPDVAMAIGAVALHARIGSDPGRGARARAHAHAHAHATKLVTRYVDPSSGLLVQSVSAETGASRDAPRGSGTALAAYALSFADADASRALGAALARSTTGVLGFGAVREHAPGQPGHGDIDSGPVVLGVSVSATGFALASARLARDRAWFTSLHRTAHLFGVPVRTGERARYLTGGPLGNAILLAMITAGPGSLREEAP